MKTCFVIAVCVVLFVCASCFDKLNLPNRIRVTRHANAAARESNIVNVVHQQREVNDSVEIHAVNKIVRYASKMMSCPGVQSPGHMIAGARSGQVLFSKSVGMASLSPSIGATPQTQWAIGSCTKAMTAILIGQLVDAGLIGWNTPITSVLPDFSTNDPITMHVTVRDLLGMQMGIPRNDVAWFTGRAGNMTRNIEKFHTLPSIAPMRQTFWYNNFGYAFLGVIVQNLTNKTWADAMRDNVFVPLGMTGSTTSVGVSIASGKYAYPHVISASTGFAVNTRPNNLNELTVDQVSAAGSVLLTANDAARYLSALLSPTIGGLVSETTASFLTKSGYVSLSEHDGSNQYILNWENDEVSPLPFQLFGYGAGWLHGLYRGRNVIAHDGSTLGQSAWTFVFPDDDLSFVFVSNMDVVSTPYRYMWDWALYARDQMMGQRSTYGVNTTNICDRFNANTGGMSLAYVDDSYITDYALTTEFDVAYVASVVGIYGNEFYGPVSVFETPGSTGKGVSFSFGTLSGQLMTGPYTGSLLLSKPDFYQVQGLGAGFGDIDPATGKATTLRMGLEVIDPVFVRV